MSRVARVDRGSLGPAGGVGVDETRTDSLSSRLLAQIEELRAKLGHFLLNQSDDLRDINARGRGVQYLGAHYAWRPLNVDGRRYQTRLLDEYGRLAALVRASLSSHQLQRFDEGQSTLSALIEQRYMTWFKTPEAALNAAGRALDLWASLLAGLDDRADGTAVLVPDTNALLWHPSLEDWHFDPYPRFTLELVPSVIGELDTLKIEHRNEEVRDKAESLIRRIKGYRSRGTCSLVCPFGRVSASFGFRRWSRTWNVPFRRSTHRTTMIASLPRRSRSHGSTRGLQSSW